MKKTNLLIGMFLVLSLFSTVSVMAYDVDDPYTVTLQWIVPSDTSFSVALCGAESSVDFDTNLTAVTKNEVQPDCQNAGAGTPMMTITNDGNLDLNFTTALTAAKPSWAVLKVNELSVYGSATTFDTTQVLINGSVGASESTDVYFWTDLTNAPAGTTSRTLQVNSSIASG